MKYLLIVILVTNAFYGNSTISAQDSEGNFDSLLVEIKALPHADAISKLTEFEANYLEKLSCGEKGLFYKEFGIKYYRNQDYLQAEEKYEQALDAFNGCKNIDISQYARTAYNAARNAQQMGDIEQVKTRINQFAQISDQIKDYDRSWYKKIINNANLLASLGEIKLANYYTEKAFAFVNKFDNPESDRAYIYKVLGLINLSLNQEEQALENLKKSNTVYSKPPINLSYLIDNKINIAVAYYRLNDYEKVRETITDLNELYSKHNIELKPETFDILVNQMMLEDGKYDEVIRNYENKLKVYNVKSKENMALISASYDNIASAYSESKKFNLAETYLDSSLFLFLSDQAESIENYIGNEIIYLANEITQNLHYRADLNFENYLENKDYSILKKNETIFSDIEKIFIKKLNLSRDDVSKLSLINHIKPIFEDAVKHFLELNKNGSENYIDDAYKYASTIKGIVLKEGTKAQNALYSSLPDSIYQKEKQLSQNLTQLENLIPTIPDLNTKDSLLTKYIQEKKNYDKYIAQIEKKHPDYYNLKYANEEPLTLQEVQNNLNNNELVLDYYATKDTLICFGISKDKISVHGHNLDKELKSKISDFRNKIEKNESVSQELNESLYKALITKNLEDHTGVHKIIILPDEDLLKIPFDVLHNGTSFLIQDYAISYLYSNNQISKGPTSKAKYNFAGFGTKYSDQLTKNLEGKIDAEYLPLNQLPMAPIEIENAKDIWGGDVYLNDKATKENFIKHASQHQILQLALHGIVNNEYLDQSALIFDDHSEDNILKTNELYQLKLNNQLTILTACNSANGKVYKGEGIRSIARGFAFAGCPSIVSSMWTAYDEPTNKIITSFNKYLKEGQDKSLALRQAKIDFIDSASPTQNQPQLWANLILIGNTDPIQTVGFYPMYIIGAVVLLILLLFLFKRSKKI